MRAARSFRLFALLHGGWGGPRACSAFLRVHCVSTMGVRCVSLSMHKERATSLCGTDHYFGRCDMVCAHAEVLPEADGLLRDLVLNG